MHLEQRSGGAWSLTFCRRNSHYAAEGSIMVENKREVAGIDDNICECRKSVTTETFVQTRWHCSVFPENKFQVKTHSHRNRFGTFRVEMTHKCSPESTRASVALTFAHLMRCAAFSLMCSTADLASHQRHLYDREGPSGSNDQKSWLQPWPWIMNIFLEVIPAEIFASSWKVPCVKRCQFITTLNGNKKWLPICIAIPARSVMDTSHCKQPTQRCAGC